LIGGLAVRSVADMFFGTHALTEIGVLPTGWPDGGPYLKQPAKWSALINICRSEVIRWMKEQRNSGK